MKEVMDLDNPSKLHGYPDDMDAPPQSDLAKASSYPELSEGESGYGTGTPHSFPPGPLGGCDTAPDTLTVTEDTYRDVQEETTNTGAPTRKRPAASGHPTQEAASSESHQSTPLPRKLVKESDSTHEESVEFHYGKDGTRSVDIEGVDRDWETVGDEQGSVSTRKTKDERKQEGSVDGVSCSLQTVTEMDEDDRTLQKHDKHSEVSETRHEHIHGDGSTRKTKQRQLQDSDTMQQVDTSAISKRVDAKLYMDDGRVLNERSDTDIEEMQGRKHVSEFEESSKEETQNGNLMAHKSNATQREVATAEDQRSERSRVVYDTGQEIATEDVTKSRTEDEEFSSEDRSITRLDDNKLLEEDNFKNTTKNIDGYEKQQKVLETDAPKGDGQPSVTIQKETTDKAEATHVKNQEVKVKQLQDETGKNLSASSQSRMETEDTSHSSQSSNVCRKETVEKDGGCNGGSKLTKSSSSSESKHSRSSSSGQMAHSDVRVNVAASGGGKYPESLQVISDGPDMIGSNVTASQMHSKSKDAGIGKKKVSFLEKEDKVQKERSETPRPPLSVPKQFTGALGMSKEQWQVEDKNVASKQKKRKEYIMQAAALGKLPKLDDRDRVESGQIPAKVLPPTECSGTVLPPGESKENHLLQGFLKSHQGADLSAEFPIKPPANPSLAVAMTTQSPGVLLRSGSSPAVPSCRDPPGPEPISQTAMTSHTGNGSGANPLQQSRDLISCRAGWGLNRDQCDLDSAAIQKAGTEGPQRLLPCGINNNNGQSATHTDYRGRLDLGLTAKTRDNTLERPLEESEQVFISGEEVNQKTPQDNNKAVSGLTDDQSHVTSADISGSGHVKDPCQTVAAKSSGYLDSCNISLVNTGPHLTGGEGRIQEGIQTANGGDLSKQDWDSLDERQQSRTTAVLISSPSQSDESGAGLTGACGSRLTSSSPGIQVPGPTANEAEWDTTAGQAGNQHCPLPPQAAAPGGDNNLSDSFSHQVKSAPDSEIRSRCKDYYTGLLSQEKHTGQQKTEPENPGSFSREENDVEGDSLPGTEDNTATNTVSERDQLTKPKNLIPDNPGEKHGLQAAEFDKLGKDKDCRHQSHTGINNQHHSVIVASDSVSDISARKSDSISETPGAETRRDTPDNRVTSQKEDTAMDDGDAPRPPLAETENAEDLSPDDTEDNGDMSQMSSTVAASFGQVASQQKFDTVTKREAEASTSGSLEKEVSDVTPRAGEYSSESGSSEDTDTDVITEEKLVQDFEERYQYDANAETDFTEDSERTMLVDDSADSEDVDLDGFEDISVPPGSASQSSATVSLDTLKKISESGVQSMRTQRHLKSEQELHELSEDYAQNTVKPHGEHTPLKVEGAIPTGQITSQPDADVTMHDDSDSDHSDGEDTAKAVDDTAMSDGEVLVRGRCAARLQPLPGMLEKRKRAKSEEKTSCVAGKKFSMQDVLEAVEKLKQVSFHPTMGIVYTAFLSETWNSGRTNIINLKVICVVQLYIR